MIAETTALDKWGYLIGIGVLLVIWLALFIHRRDLHVRMLTLSVILLPLAPLGQYFFLQDYWKPPIILPIMVMGRTYGGVADLLFAFVMGGLAAAVYPELSRRYPIRGIQKPRRWIAFAFIALEGTAVLVLTGVFRMNSIFSSSLGFVATSVAILIVRPDLWRSSLVSAVLSGVALTCAEGALSFLVPLYLSRYWLLFHTKFGILIFGKVPLTEALWGATFGLVTGILYDAYEGNMLGRRNTHIDSQAFHPSLITQNLPANVTVKVSSKRT